MLENSFLSLPLDSYRRTVGYYINLEDAKHSVEINNLDIWETIYDYAIIEKVKEGLYQVPTESYAFEYNEKTGHYDPIDKLPVEEYNNYTQVG